MFNFIPPFCIVPNWMPKICIFDKERKASTLRTLKLNLVIIRLQYLFPNMFITLEIWNGWGYARRSYLLQKFDNYYFSFTKAQMFEIDLIAQLHGYSSTCVIITWGTITHTILFNCPFYITLQTTFWDRNRTSEYK